VKALLILFLIFAFAIGIAYVAEALNPRIRTRIDIESLYGAPLIGSI
jgi:capsular polysaccharide biosynthesis protein